MANINPEEISLILQEQLKQVQLDSSFEEVGTVLQLANNIAHIYGLSNVKYGELIAFENEEKAVALNLEEDNIGGIILSENSKVKAGDKVFRTKQTLSIQVNDQVLGRVLNTLGEPIDNQGALQGETFQMPLERKAPGVIYRESVNEPLQTGITAIDALTPIGRGQRQLIIGDRQTGKTTIAIDTIINQRKFFDQNEPVYCVYVAIGQKASTVAYIVDILTKNKAMEYTTIVTAPASASAPLQFYAPFTGTAIGEYFRDTGRNALIIYDDLSKQAVAYREVSLLLRRPPGREAYPGDVFYLHSRLLERAAKITKDDDIATTMNNTPPSIQKKVKGGGSLTALPIIETQGSDISAYIPTNVVSITDGQIFLETNLFNSGIKPAMNVGLSVSRVGGAAQVKNMRKVAGSLKLTQAQFKELEAFANLGSSLDAATKSVIQRGRINQEILKQNQYDPLSVEEQIAILYVSINGYLDKVPLDKIQEVKKEYFDILHTTHSAIMKNISHKELKQEIIDILVKEIQYMVDVHKTQEETA